MTMRISGRRSLVACDVVGRRLVRHQGVGCSTNSVPRLVLGGGELSSSDEPDGERLFCRR